MAERKKLAVIDGKSVFYRGYYAMPNLSTADGTPTGGVYGFTAMSLELIKKLKPDYVAVAWDKPKTNIRSRLKIYPDYKAGRKPAPPDFYAQIPILHELLKVLGWPMYELDDYEADDIMCTLAKKAEAAGLETLLITSDLDALQCLQEHTSVYALKKGFSNIERFDPAYFTAKHGIRTDQFLDLKSLKGDSSDNIPGVPGIGEKTAVELLQKYDNIDGIYDNLALIKDSVAKKLEAGRESAMMSKKVAVLFDDAPVPLDLADMDTHDLDVVALKAMLQKLEFKSLLRTLPDYMRVDGGEASASDGQHAESKAETNSIETRNSSNKNGLRAVTPVKVEIIDNNDATNKLRFDGEELVLSAYCNRTHGREPELIMLADNKMAYVFDLNKIDFKKFYNSALKMQPSIRVLGYDVKAALQALLEMGLTLPTVAGDVQVGSFLVDPLRRSRELAEMAEADLGLQTSSLEISSAEDFKQSAGEFAAIVRALNNYQSESISELTRLIKLAEEIEWPVIPVLAGMEHEGIGLDTDYLKQMAIELEGQISDIEQTIYGHADQEFNISSPSQLAEILYEKLGLSTATIKKGKTGFSTAADELAKLRGLHPIVDLISQYREFTKLKNTYVDTLPKQVDENSRLHTTFSLTTAQTGRLSSLDPNLQNIPVKTELGNRIRTAFVPCDGHVFVSADYSQFELRLAAAFSGDEAMIKAFNNDEDIHELTAAEVLGIKPSEVTKELRRRAKAVNFGILYGQGPHGLSVGTGMTYPEARDFIARYFEVRPKLKAYLSGIKQQAIDKGYVETLLGRRRPTPDAKSSNHMVRETALRQAINMPLQGTAADLTKLAMIRVSQKLPYGAKMLLQIHDSILIECPEKHAEEVSEILKTTMESVYPNLGVKLKVDVSTGENWGEL